ncbi:MAG TPA: M17 family peptidase N-terminal domain-containing protein [Polyangia bacterium]
MLPVAFLPVDLSRWDHGPGGDALVVPVWSDVRPLRGATGLLDWRLCGRLSQMIREGRVSGAVHEKLLLVTNRIPWRRVLAVGVGVSTAFDEDAFRSAIDCSLQALRGIGASSIAMALPGRDIDLIRPDRAARQFMEVLAQSEQSGGAWLERLTVIDAPSASKSLGDAFRALPSAPPSNVDALNVVE